ncbi:tryptophan synthase beta subunit [Candidatus Caldarchaeum subterraneum]|uniref:Tryptophan synthase beta chain n=1 Tax=Caldiarchaeum subterraneum TaxID=311458 RepID=E6N6L6_CALS0|nr:tryptophan synthase beta subunit [Candidatus Caldarchaeum subterraneum]BAJ50783.1 tryptophan synthase beta subunit [Candidatus Caldarchaeum subterraneum]
MSGSAGLVDSWYNILPDLPRPVPPPIDPFEDEWSHVELLNRIFPSVLLDQEFTAERYIEVPDEVKRIYASIGRPTPLRQAVNLEKMLSTPARIYFKREDLSPTGSHKTNTAVAQAYYAKSEGVRELVTETGAGQWGSSLALACSLYGIKCKVFMTRSSYEHKPYRRVLMQMLGAEVIPSPSSVTETGRRVLSSNPNHVGSLGVAISEALEVVLKSPESRYAIGSVMNFVMIHQSVIGLEAIWQLEEIGVTPDIVIGCVGGGSNFCGLTFPMIGLKSRGEGYRETRFIAVESLAAPKLTRGEYRYDYPDTACILPLMKMYSIGKDYVPPPIHAAGLRYHAAAPTLSLLVKEGLVEPRAYGQDEVLEAAMMFAKAEGIVVAPETAHAVKCVIDEAIKCRETGEKLNILFCLSGHGLLDLSSYEGITA